MNIDPLVEFVRESCQKVRQNVRGSRQVPTDLEVARFLHGFVGGLHTLLSDPTMRRRYGTAARERAGEAFAMTQTHARYATLYADILAGSPARRVTRRRAA